MAGDGTGCPGKEQQAWGHLWIASGVFECCAAAYFVTSSGKRALCKKKCISNSLLYINEVKGEVLPEALMANVVLGSLFWFGDSSVSLAQEMSGCKAGQVLLAVQSKTIQLLWKNYRVCAEADI